MPDSGDRLPDHLWDLSMSLFGRTRLENDWIAGLGLQIGSPSDKPFDSGDEWLVTVNATLQIPAQGRDSWIFLLNYSNARSFCRHIPLPGAAYAWNPSEEFQAVIGMPFSMIRAELADNVVLTANYLFPQTVDAQIEWRPIEQVGLFAGFEWDNDHWLRAGRADNDDLLFLYYKKVGGGVTWDLAEGVSLTAETGWAFDRFFFEGEDYDDRDNDRIDIEDGPFVSLAAKLAF
jgi:hypothetical protein